MALFSICLSFNSCGTHILVFWIFPNSRSRLKTAHWLTTNCLASCFCVCKSSSSNNTCNSTSSIFGWFFMFLDCNLEVITFKTSKPSFTCILRWSMFTVNGMIQQPFSSNENKKCCLRILFVRYNFRHLEYNTILCTTFLIYHSCASDTSWWHNKMAVSNIYSTNCSGALSVAWISHFIPGSLNIIINQNRKIQKVQIICWSFHRTRVLLSQNYL